MLNLFVLFLTILGCGCGLPLPEDALLLCLGILWRAEFFNWTAIPVAILAVILGDLALYAGGRRYAWRFLRGRPIENTIRSWYARHGSLTVALLRVAPGCRVPGFVLAGAVGVPMGRFILADLAGCALSLPLFVGIGWTLAGHFDRARDAVLGVLLGAFVVLLLACAALWLWRWWGSGLCRPKV